MPLLGGRGGAAVTDHQSTPDHWAAVEAYAQQVSSTDDCLLELRARVEALEGRYETMRLATLEWGKDVENLQRWSDQHLMRIERLEGTRDPASKTYKINEPLKLTPRQQEEIAALLRPNPKPIPNPSQIRSSLVKRVAAVLADEDAPVDLWHEDARAAIRVVATWLREQRSYVDSNTGLAQTLEQEAGDA